MTKEKEFKNKKKILIENAVKRKDGYLYYLGNDELIMAKALGSKQISNKEFELELRKAKYYFKKNARFKK